MMNAQKWKEQYIRLELWIDWHDIHIIIPRETTKKLFEEITKKSIEKLKWNKKNINPCEGGKGKIERKGKRKEKN